MFGLDCLICAMFGPDCLVCAMFGLGCLIRAKRITVSRAPLSKGGFCRPGGALSRRGIGRSGHGYSSLLKPAGEALKVHKLTFTIRASDSSPLSEGEFCRPGFAVSSRGIGGSGHVYDSFLKPALKSTN